MNTFNRDVNKMRLIKTYLILLAVSFLGLIRTGEAQTVSQYQPPDLSKKFINVEQLSLTSEQRKTIATLLGEYARSSQCGSRTDAAKIQCKILGIALTIDPENRTAYIGNQRFIKGEKAPLYKEKDVSAIANGLKKASAPLRDTNKPEEAKLLAYINWAIQKIHPGEEQAEFEYLKYCENHTLDWSWAMHKQSGVKTKNTVNKETKAEAADFTQLRSTIKGVMVVTLPNGSYVGKTVDIIIDARKLSNDAKTGTIGFRRPVGNQMETVLEEAVRVVQIKYPRWKLHSIKIGFSDKYTSKEGGSVGAAFAILFLSLIEGFKIDTNFAITGDITVDGKLRKVGALPSKIHGAIIDRCSIVAIPKENEYDVKDLYLLYSVEDIWKTQIFSVSNLQEAAALSRSDRPEKLKKAITVFKKVQNMGINDESFLKKPECIKLLKRVLEVAPNHLSASFLLQFSQGIAPKRLSVSASLEQVLNTTHHFNKYAFTNWIFREVPEKQVNETLKKLSSLEKLLHKDIVPFSKKYSEFIWALNSYVIIESKKKAWMQKNPHKVHVGSRQSSTYKAWLSKVKAYREAAVKKREALKAELEALQTDKSFIEKLIRE